MCRVRQRDGALPEPRDGSGLSEQGRQPADRLASRTHRFLAVDSGWPFATLRNFLGTVSVDLRDHLRRSRYRGRSRCIAARLAGSATAERSGRRRRLAPITGGSQNLSPTWARPTCPRSDACARMRGTTTSGHGAG